MAASDERRGVAPPDGPQRLAPPDPRGAWPARVGASALLLAAGLLSGCDSTQQKNLRAKLQAERLLAAREPQPTPRPNPDVRVESVSLVRGNGSTAVVVELRNRSDRPLTDLPIAVGVRAPDGRRTRLNDRKGLKWFQTHVPAIPAGGRTTWVFAGRGEAGAGRAWARVGAARAPVVTNATSLPELEASAEPAARPATKGARPRRATARVVVENPSDVPQYGLQVYALARAGGRWVAAGKVEVEHLATGGRATAEIPLTGSPGRRPLRVQAVPTIFE